jgi:hypothetical protein
VKRAPSAAGDGQEARSETCAGQKEASYCAPPLAKVSTLVELTGNFCLPPKEGVVRWFGGEWGENHMLWGSGDEGQWKPFPEKRALIVLMEWLI